MLSRRGVVGGPCVVCSEGRSRQVTAASEEGSPPPSLYEWCNSPALSLRGVLFLNSDWVYSTVKSAAKATSHVPLADVRAELQGWAE